MKKPNRVLLPIALFAVLAPLPAAAQDAAGGHSLAEIATALSRIAEVMEKQLEGGRLDLLMRRQEAGQRRLDMVDNRLRSAERELQGYRQNLSRSEMELSRLADRAAAEQMGWEPVALEMHLESMEFDLDATRRRVAELEGTISRLEQEKSRRQRELEDWQAFIDRELSGMQ